MMLFPRTIFGRSVLLILTIIILSIFAVVLIAWQYSAHMRLRTTMMSINSVVADVVDDNFSQESVEVLASQEIVLSRARPLFVFPAHNLEQTRLAQQVKSNSTLPVQVWQQLNAPEILWLRYPRKHNLWIGVPRDSLQGNIPLMLVAQIGLISLLVVLGSILAARHINQPLRQLVGAAKQLGQGEIPEKLPEKGPREIQMLTETFNKMVDDIAHFDSERSLMLAGISHDLRTPLTRLQLALELEPDLNNNTKQEMLGDIAQISTMQQQFLTYMTAGGDEDFLPTDINALLNDCVKQFQPSAHSIHVDLQTKVQELTVQPIALSRVIMNLIQNALQYANTEVSLKSFIEDKQLIIEVWDNGPGVPDAALSQIFKPLYRHDKARSDTQGSGLGLAIVERIIQKHNGHVRAWNREAGGLVVALYLPI